MGPPRFRTEAEPGETLREPGNPPSLDPGDRPPGAGRAWSADLDGPEAGVFLPEPVVPGRLVEGWGAFDDRPVFLACLANRELTGQPAGGLGGLRPEDDPRDRAIEPVDRPEIDRGGVVGVQVPACPIL